VTVGLQIRFEIELPTGGGSRSAAQWSIINRTWASGVRFIGLTEQEEKALAQMAIFNLSGASLGPIGTSIVYVRWIRR
jgi:hypothetical protein